MIDARTLLLAEQARRAEGSHAEAELLREATVTINRLRGVLRLARVQIASDRDAILEAHGFDGVIQDDDIGGQPALAELEAVISLIDEALK